MAQLRRDCFFIGSFLLITHIRDEWVRDFFLWRLTHESTFRLFQLDPSKSDLCTCVGKETWRRMRHDEVHLLCEAAREWVSATRPGWADRRRLQVDQVMSFCSNEVCSRGQRPCREQHMQVMSSIQHKHSRIYSCWYLKKNAALAPPLPRSGHAWQADKSNSFFYPLISPVIFSVLLLGALSDIDATVDSHCTSHTTQRTI